MKKKKQTIEDKVYKILENMTDEQYYKFYSGYFGWEKMWEDIRDSIGIDEEDTKEALKLAKSIIRNEK